MTQYLELQESERVTLLTYIVYFIRNGDYDSNIDTDEILYLLGDWDAEDCMDSTPRIPYQ